ncbi:UDP-N-acetylmuramoyl-L-alanine--D-glutamate ligase [Candidatus Babeliales bacterium]|nr:UDP-N-acetylmuramoyl-L-alanine--D-glutamate ligase [Candidatus Babeliales bacterium]
MKYPNLNHKKIGIWGFGIVGQSVLQFLKNYPCSISIMDKKQRPETLHSAITWIVQTPENITTFLTNHDLIIPSPGIILHDYAEYTEKFVHELDIFTSLFTGYNIAITGTFGKTTVTSFLAQCIPNAKAAGNIGHAMLDAILDPLVILELSSYQLHYAQNFAPDLAIWTNFAPNHLDHHRDTAEYFAAKCNLLKHQNTNQITLLPAEIWTDITKIIHVKSKIFLFSLQSINTNQPLFTVINNQIVLQEQNKLTVIFNDITQLPKTTFLINWIVILAALHLSKLQPLSLLDRITTIQAEPHRLELVTTKNGIKFFNDSKSTLWQTTQYALDQFPNQRIALFVGGLSKGLDRSPLMQYAQNKPITIFNFGAEAETLANFCKKYNVAHNTAGTLEQALNQCHAIINQFDVILFSPAGSSFDLFKDFAHRGNEFKRLIQAMF